MVKCKTHYKCRWITKTAKFFRSCVPATEQCAPYILFPVWDCLAALLSNDWCLCYFMSVHAQTSYFKFTTLEFKIFVFLLFRQYETHPLGNYSVEFFRVFQHIPTCLPNSNFLHCFWLTAGKAEAKSHKPQMEGDGMISFMSNRHSLIKWEFCQYLLSPRKMNKTICDPTLVANGQCNALTSCSDGDQYLFSFENMFSISSWQFYIMTDYSVFLYCIYYISSW